MANYSLWSWGYNTQGNLGFGDTLFRSSPVQVGTLTNWSAVNNSSSVSLNLLSINTSGQIFDAGYNTYYQLGLGDTLGRSSPVQVGTGTTWSKISSGYFGTLAITIGGSLYGWGYNRYGESGVNSNVKISVPTQVGTGTNWQSLGLGVYFSNAITTQGELYTWGCNSQGQLGLGDIGSTLNRSSPVQIGSLTNWSAVSAGTAHTIALTTAGALYAWGYNPFGQLGLPNTATNRSTPTQIGTLTSWASIDAGYRFSTALDIQGSLYTWGLNLNGQLGLGDSVNRSSPVQVGALTGWSAVIGGGYHTSAINSSKLFVFGKNLNGQLGLGNTVDRSSPVQLGTLTSWSSIGVGHKNMVGLITIPSSPVSVSPWFLYFNNK